MASAEIHVFVTDEGDYGFTLTSPQIPELAFGRASEREFMREYKDSIRATGFRGTVVGHMQSRGVTDDGAEYVIRRQTGASEPERLVVANAIIRSLADEVASRELIDGLQPTSTGEFVFVACLASDTVGWLIDQLRPSRDVLIAALSVADVMIAMTQVASDESLDWPSMDDMQWTRDTTLGDLVTKQAGSKPLVLRA